MRFYQIEDKWLLSQLSTVKVGQKLEGGRNPYRPRSFDWCDGAAQQLGHWRNLAHSRHHDPNAEGLKVWSNLPGTKASPQRKSGCIGTKTAFPSEERSEGRYENDLPWKNDLKLTANESILIRILNKYLLKKKKDFLFIYNKSDHRGSE